MAKEGKYATLRLPSGEMRMVPIICRATIGTLGNGDHSLINLGKAGRKRHMGIRPTVRGSVMNPNDHPHGGGEGKDVYKRQIIGIPLAAGVWIQLFGWTLNPMFGAAAMSLSSFCVVTNALRLNLFKD